MSNVPESIVVSDDGYSLPTIEVLTGRGFITGKSGSGKSNTASVVAEELLASGVSILIVDTDGEYYGLKEQFDVLHAGGDDNCDVEVGAEDADEIAETAIVENVPVVLDVSGYLDGATVDEVIKSVVEALFRVEKEERKPFLLLVEEVHEFIPETGGLDDLGEMLIRVAKRGRKRGLGLVGMSQRPAAVDKDFITQCDWLVWHRLTWENDTKVAGQIMGSDYSEAVQDLDTGEAFVMTDWDEVITRVQFRRKRTLDAGATPGLSALEDGDAGGETPAEPPPDGGAPGERAPEGSEPAGEASPADAGAAETPEDGAAAGEQAASDAATPDEQPAAGDASAAGEAASDEATDAVEPARQPRQAQPVGDDAGNESRAASSAANRRAASGGQQVVVEDDSIRQRARRMRAGEQGAGGDADDAPKRRPAESHPSDDPPVYVLWEFGHMLTHAAWSAAVRAKRGGVTVAAAFAAGCRAIASSFVAGCRALAASGARARRALDREWTGAPGGASADTDVTVQPEGDADDPDAGDAATADADGDAEPDTGSRSRVDDARADRYVTVLILVALAVLAGVLVIAAA